MKKKLPMIITILTIGFQQNGIAASETVDGLLRECNSSVNFRVSLCLGYLEGVLDTYEELKNAGHINALYCRPVASTIGQGRQIFLNYANAHPEKWHLPAPSVIISSLAEVFPCK